jgi:hypothetical protein
MGVGVGVGVGPGVDVGVGVGVGTFVGPGRPPAPGSTEELSSEQPIVITVNKLMKRRLMIFFLVMRLPSLVFATLSTVSMLSEVGPKMEPLLFFKIRLGLKESLVQGAFHGAADFPISLCATLTGLVAG